MLKYQTPLNIFIKQPVRSLKKRETDQTFIEMTYCLAELTSWLKRIDISSVWVVDPAALQNRQPLFLCQLTA